MYVPTNLYIISLHLHYHYELYHVCIFCEVERKTIRATELAEKLNWFKRKTRVVNLSFCLSFFICLMGIMGFVI